jgi:hypothetical protein
MSQTLTLCGTSSDLTTISGPVGLLCELATDSPWLKGIEARYTPDELLGSADHALGVAHSVVSKLTEYVARFQGIPPLSTFEEPLLEQVSYNVQALHLDRWIRAQKISVCRFDSYSPWFDRLRQISALTGFGYELTARVPFGQTNWVERGIVDLGRSFGRPAELLRRIAPLRSRVWSSIPLRRLARGAPRGGIWFYSTAYNCTRIALEYEDYFPQKMNFLVEDPSTGGKGLSEIGRTAYALYAWSGASDAPSVSEARKIGRSLTEAVAGAPLAADESLLRNALLKSDWWDHFIKRLLPFALFHERTLRRWCDAVAPEMLVVGNAGWERSLLQSPIAQRIPSLMLQHGIMHRVYAVADQPVTYFLIRGKFFLNLLNERLRQKTIICNHPERTAPISDRHSSSRRGILFITMPYEVAPLFHRADLRDILRCLLRVSYHSGRQLLIRVHPLESTSSYQELVSEIQRESGLRSEVIYSQGPGSEDILARSSVAILFFSTMFLDCMRHGIPIVSLNWHWFPNKEHFKHAGIFNFASDLRDLERLVQRAIEGQLPSRLASLSEFLAPTRQEDVCRLLSRLWDSSPLRSSSRNLVEW